MNGTAHSEPRQRGASSEVDEPPHGETRQRGASSEVDTPPQAKARQRVTSPAMNEPPHQDTCPPVTSSEMDGPPHGETRRRGRYIPAAVRREVYRRDGARCTYVDGRGQRCGETHYLELHHLQPFARNGAHLASNLTLRCVAHNALAAERDFGPQLMAERRGSTRHEAFAAQTRLKKCRSE
jgi:5-methylcytosine-specific restriction endonuclease McrA